MGEGEPLALPCVKICVVYMPGFRPPSDVAINSMGPVLEPSARRLLCVEVGVPLMERDPC